MEENKKSALVIIGNEILSGRTLDKNTQYIAQAMSDHGVPLSEVRVVPDIEGKIVDAVNAMRAEYDFVFTTGGIGPTHDDITAESIAKAFDVPFGRHDGAYQILLDYYGEAELTQARASMADMPLCDAVEIDFALLRNPVSAAPGFRIGNVFVMAGVPKIMQAMLDHVLEMITPGQALQSRTVMVGVPESRVADVLETVQNQFDGVDVGSYPQFKDGQWGVSAVLRGTDDGLLDQAVESLLEILHARGIETQVL